MWIYSGSVGNYKALVERLSEGTNILEVCTLQNKGLFPVDVPRMQTAPKTPL